MTRSSSLFAICLLAACGPWPRYADLDDDPDIIDPSVDPRSLVEIDWEQVEGDELLVRAGANSSNPTNIVPRELGALQGVQVTSSLRGIGWDSSFEPLVMQATCGGEPVEVPRDPGREGDWTGDVDFVRVDISADSEPVSLCARALIGGDHPDQIGFDLLLYPLDDCGLPAEPTLLTEEPLGADRAGPVGEWRTPVAPGASYGVLIAGFTAPDALQTEPYTLGLSLVPQADGEVLCPYLPAESEL